MAKIAINSLDENIFSGLYETIWLGLDKDIDILMEMADDLNIDCNDIDVPLDFHGYLKAIVKLYKLYFEQELGGTWNIEGVYSPKEYNFTTDNFTLSWTKENLSENEMKEKFSELIEEFDTDYDNFETHEIYDGSHGYELYYNFVSYKYNNKEIYWDDEKECYVTE